MHLSTFSHAPAIPILCLESLREEALDRDLELET